MDATILRQTDEALGYDKHMNAMVFDMEKKRVAQKAREMPQDEYAMIDAQKIMDVADAANSLRLMLDGKIGNLSVIAHPGVSVDSEQFARAAQDVWQVDAVVSTYNEISAPFMSANGASALQQNIMRHALELLQSVGNVKNGVTRAIDSDVRTIGARGDPNDPLHPKPDIILC